MVSSNKQKNIPLVSQISYSLSYVHAAKKGPKEGFGGKKK